MEAQALQNVDMRYAGLFLCESFSLVSFHWNSLKAMASYFNKFPRLKCFLLIKEMHGF